MCRDDEETAIAPWGPLGEPRQSAAIFLLMWFGVSGVLHASYGIDLMYVLWPSSLILTTGWRTTPTGILITVNAVSLNCAMYAALALALRFAIRLCVRQLKRATR